MLTLFSYPDLYGVADNNPYGLKVYAFLKLCKLAFRHEHILDTKNAPRGQLPYLLDGEKTIGDGDAIISHLIARYAIPIDNSLMASQRDTDHERLDEQGALDRCPPEGRTRSGRRETRLLASTLRWSGRAGRVERAEIHEIAGIRPRARRGSDDRIWHERRTASAVERIPSKTDRPRLVRCLLDQDVE